MRTWRDPEVIKRLLTRPATWAVVGLSANTKRAAYSIGEYLRDRLGMSIVPVNLRGEDAWASGDIAGSLRSPARSRSWTAVVNSQRVAGSSTRPSPRRIGWASRPCGFSSACAALKLLFFPAKTAGRQNSA
jgi:hypothetical protein